MDDLQRKIDLQSPGDLAYLRENMDKAVKQLLDLRLPPSAAGGKDDGFRSEVEDLMREYIRKTLELALPSISINGLDASPSILTPGEPNAHSDPSIIDPNDPSYEPYDTRLAQKLRDRYAALEEETTRVAELRHEAPVTAADAYIEQLTREIAEGERVLEARKEAVDNLPGVTLDEISYKSPDVQESLDRGRAGLEALRNVTKVKAVLERAREAVAEVEKG